MIIQKLSEGFSDTVILHGLGHVEAEGDLDISHVVLEAIM